MLVQQVIIQKRHFVFDQTFLKALLIRELIETFTIFPHVLRPKQFLLTLYVLIQYGFLIHNNAKLVLLYLVMVIKVALYYLDS